MGGLDEARPEDAKAEQRPEDDAKTGAEKPGRKAWPYGNPKFKLGEELPRLPRSHRCPGIDVIKKSQQSKFGDVARHEHRKPKLYAFLFPGASDTVKNNGWLNFEVNSPLDWEAATYEWPGHLCRKDEPSCTNLEQLAQDAYEAFKEAMQLGHFIVIGHSIGAVLMTRFCQIAEERLGMNPLLALSLDRAGPHIPYWSFHGFSKLAREPDKFLANYMPSTLETKGLEGSTHYETFIIDQRMSNQILDVGAYRFPCPIHVYRAGWERSATFPPQDIGDLREFCSYFHTPLTGPHPYRRCDYDDWSFWTDDVVEVREVEPVAHSELIYRGKWSREVSGMISDLLAGADGKPRG